ncbi:MAG: ParB/RepB/Spo0J family partition protein [Ruminococcaceae bacterium]|nr:ParB/RepB/Spo0J family partition protein [Oscillospiraceae bacterium]
MAVKKGGLGRGLDSLFNENSTEENGVLKLNINDIEPNREQPRKDFDDDSVSELADSIAQHGLIQPIVVTPLSNGRYSIVAGERRWRACRIAGLQEVPVIVKDASKQELMEIALIENLQREDLNPVEEAFGYRSLIDSFGLTQEEVADRMGKSRSAVTNALRLLNLNEDELDALRKGLITAGHARCFIGIDDADIRAKMLTAALDGASVRDLERMAQLAKKPAKAPKKEEKNKLYSEVELSLRSELHRKVKIVSTGKGKGKITIEFYSDKELCDFANKLTD